jgi:hypothetical protein
MRNIPKYFATKQDYINVMQLFPKTEWEPLMRQLLSERYHWVEVGVVEEENGVNDKTHKVSVEHTEDGSVIFRQLELQENPTAKIFRVGYSVVEVEGVLG